MAAKASVPRGRDHGDEDQRRLRGRDRHQQRHEQRPGDEERLLHDRLERERRRGQVLAAGHLREQRPDGCEQRRVGGAERDRDGDQRQQVVHRRRDGDQRRDAHRERDGAADQHRCLPDPVDQTAEQRRRDPACQCLCRRDGARRRVGAGLPADQHDDAQRQHPDRQPTDERGHQHGPHAGQREHGREPPEAGPCGCHRSLSECCVFALEQALRLVRGPLDQLAHLARRLRESRQHVRRDDLRVGGVGPAHPDAHAPEVVAADSLLDALEAVVARDAAALPGPDLAERQVDLVVHHHEPVEVELVAARARDRPRGRTRSCSVCGSSTATRGIPGPDAAVGDEPAELLARARQLPALGEQVRDLEADVVAGAGVARPRVAEADEQEVDRSARPAAAEKAQD